MIKDIVTHDIKSQNNPTILEKKLRLVEDFNDPEVKNCIQDLNDTLDDLIERQGNSRGVIGLSANQINYDYAISAVTIADKRYILINPTIIEQHGYQRLFRIGCFSLYEYRAMVRYNDDIVIEYYDPKGKKQTLHLSGDNSCVIQHEMDHLQGDLLFDRLENKEKDLFVPREHLYKDNKVPLKNHGIFFEIRRRLGLIKPMPGTIYYSSLFNDYTDYVNFVDKNVIFYQELIDTIIQYNPPKAKLLEVGSGTSSLSIYLNKQNYLNTCAENDKDLLDLAQRINKDNKTKVNYNYSQLDKLPYVTKQFNTIFSIEALETLDNNQLIKTLKEGLRVADRYIFMVPTIKVKNNLLRGNERLRSVNSWKKILTKKFNIIETKIIKDGQYVIFVIE